MKRIFLLVVLFFTVSTIQAQDKFLKFGIKAGVNFSNVKGDVENIDFKTKSGYHFGGLVEMRVFKNLSIQPELLYSVQGAKVDTALDGVEDLDFKYVTIPVMAKFYLNENLSLEAGPQFAFLADDNAGDTFKTKSFDLSLAGGLSYDITRNIFLQARYIAGLSEVSDNADIKNTNIQLSLGLKF